MTLSRVIEICEAVAGGIFSRWSPSAPDAVQRVYESEIITEPTAPNVITGRQVYVFPTSYVTAELATRGTNRLEHVVTVVLAELYTTAGPVTNAWLDERLLWAEQTVWHPLDDPRQPAILAGVWPQRAEVIPYDIEELVQRKLWLSWVTATLREDR